MYERKLRSLKREKEESKIVGDKDDLKNINKKMSAFNKEYTTFLEDNNLKRDYGREYVVKDINKFESKKDIDTLNIPDAISKLYNFERELNPKEKYILDKYINDNNISITTDNKILMTYRPKNDKILVNPDNKNIEYYDVTKILTHETIHMIDNRTGFTRNNKKIFTNYLDNANKYIMKNEKYFKNLFNDDNIKENMDISDLFASITRNRINGNYAHNLNYWKRNLTRESEMVANLGNIYISENEEIINIIEGIPSLNKLYGKVKKWYEENI